jgi:predicted GNAT family N-acyltransferase
VPDCPAGFLIDRLDTDVHVRNGFSCGEPALDAFLHNHAGQDQTRNLSATHVLFEEDTKQIAGYVSLVNSHIPTADLPAEAAKKLGKRNEIPAILLGKMAVDLRHRKKRYGEFLLTYALERSLEISRAVGCHAVFVDAKNEDVAAFYRKYGFIDMPERALRLYIPISTVAQLF